jgi:UDP-N-acetylglucosamine 2-epimerase (non-hydrolysing)
MTIIGTRPDIIKLSETIKKCDVYFDHILTHTGQNYDYTLNEIFFKDLGLRQPDYFLGVAGGDLGETIGNVISKSYKLLVETMPDAVLVLGDTNSALCTISAKRLKIPIFHLEAGNRCFDENLPEEINRRIVDHISDVNLTYSEHARRFLLAEGVRKEYTFVVGSPMAEVLTKNKKKIENSDIMERLGLKKQSYIVLSAHREENIDIKSNFYSLMCSINDMAEYFNVPVIYSVHPRSEKFINEREFKFNKRVRSIKPLGFSDYINLQKNSFCVVSDSGTLPEEASFYKFPAVSIRTSTERPEAMDKGNFIIGSISANQVIQSVELSVEMGKNQDVGSDVPCYVENNMSQKVINIIQSYTNIINQMVWRKT